MSNHLEWGHPHTALAEIRPADKHDRQDYLHAAKLQPPYPPIWQANLVNSDGDGLALIGTREALLTFLDRARAHVARHTDPGHSHA
ncbi:Uncharacterised protein [Mycobacteroides abscessus]|uniref:hypothetical protein n=1 Tax=Mycobacteriaceae TaxID=1762 RepID=UPI0002D496E2|nr:MULTISPECIES: hypothetical protein [Mycobacteriaceae]MCT7372577.1 hypothetical protein [Mycolicibacterium llatzerense]WGI35822.1 hypothetical protein QDT91_28195 [Mycolicibacterium aubagnense]CPT78072.1 Uncharacterised protein [Mycobacteroides abscessus]CPU63232.1 Uncharacterised protein [Mycobacteroides abscessus]SKK65718.1 Uncharacterised protein [Mycobacteroides abscessus subsp. massiliense]